MDCIVRKLKATVNNDNLPVFKNVVLKNYITTSQNGQYIPFPDIFSHTRNTQIKVKYETVNLTGAVKVFGFLTNTYIYQNQQYCRVFIDSGGQYATVSANIEITVLMNTKDGAYSVNGTAYDDLAQETENALFARMMAFASYNAVGTSVAGKIKIKEIEITTHTTADDTGAGEVYTLVPAEVNGVACLIDSVRGTVYGEANNGTLICG